MKKKQENKHEKENKHAKGIEEEMERKPLYLEPSDIWTSEKPPLATVKF